MPYTEEFAKLKAEFFERTLKKLSDAEFWSALVSVAKKGGVRGKARTPAPTRVDEEGLQTLRKMLPASLGERDRLPYTERFESVVRRFNAITGLAASHREVWLSVLRIAK